MFTFAMKFAETGAVTNRKAIISNSWIEGSPDAKATKIDAAKSMPIPTVPTFVGAWRRVMGSLNFKSPITPTKTNPEPTNSDIAAANVAIVAKVIR